MGVDIVFASPEPASGTTPTRSVQFQYGPANATKSAGGVSSVLQNETRDNEPENKLDPNKCDPLKPSGTPSVVVIGVMKGGTFFLHEMLRMHSKIEAADISPPEMNFFDQEERYAMGEMQCESKRMSRSSAEHGVVAHEEALRRARKGTY